jgi:hypothetical protein
MATSYFGLEDSNLSVIQIMYLTREQLAELIDCSPSSLRCMKRWLDHNGWPYVVGRSGFPKVARSYHDSRLGGAMREIVVETQEPNFGALK